MILRGDIEESLRKFFKEAKSAGAYLLISENPELKKSLIGFLKCEKRTYCKKCAYCQNTNLLDLYTYSGETLKIEEARQIQVEAQKSSWNGNKIFIIESQIPRDAQAVLLKTMEEPRANNYFIIEAAAVAGFTKPFLSRLNVFRAKSKDEGDKSLAKKFLTNWNFGLMRGSKNPMDMILEKSPPFSPIFLKLKKNSWKKLTLIKCCLNISFSRRHILNPFRNHRHSINMTGIKTPKILSNNLRHSGRCVCVLFLAG